MELAINKYADKPNLEGEKLGQEMTYDKTVDSILSQL